MNMLRFYMPYQIGMLAGMAVIIFKPDNVWVAIVALITISLISSTIYFKIFK